MKKKILFIAPALLVSSLAFAEGDCYLQKMDSTGRFGETVVTAKDATAGGEFRSADGKYKIEVAQLTQTGFKVTAYVNGRGVLQISTIAIGNRFQWVRSSAVLSFDGSGVSLWCSKSGGELSSIEELLGKKKAHAVEKSISRRELKVTSSDPVEMKEESHSVHAKNAI